MKKRFIYIRDEIVDQHREIRNTTRRLAARLDEAEKRITELELATPCPMLKSICEDWQYTVKPSPDKQEMVSDESMIEDCFNRLCSVNDGKLSYFDSIDVLQDLINKVRKQEARHGQS